MTSALYQVDNGSLSSNKSANNSYKMSEINTELISTQTYLTPVWLNARPTTFWFAWAWKMRLSRSVGTLSVCLSGQRWDV